MHANHIGRALTVDTQDAGIEALSQTALKVFLRVSLANFKDRDLPLMLKTMSMLFQPLSRNRTNMPIKKAVAFERDHATDLFWQHHVNFTFALSFALAHVYGIFIFPAFILTTQILPFFSDATFAVVYLRGKRSLSPSSAGHP